MAFEFKFPDVGEGVHEGVLVKWRVKAGDAIKEDAIVAEVETDKAIVEVPSPKAGKVLELRFKEGDRINVGDVMITIDDGSAVSKPTASVAASPQAPSPRPAAPSPVLAPSSPVPASSGIGVLAAPATRQLARDLGVDIKAVRGSGPAGRVTQEDVKAAAGKGNAPAPTSPVPVSVAAAPAAARAAKVSFEKYGRTIRVAYKGIRKTIGESTLNSVRTIPHVTHMDEADVTELWDMREKKKEFAENLGVKLTILPFIAKAACHALAKHPYVNSSLDEETGEIVLKKYYNIGFAVDAGGALTVPAVKGADKMSVIEIATQLQKLAELARAGDLSLDDLRGGTFTITNIGSVGGTHFTPIINHPECAILGVGRAREMPAVRDGKVVVRRILPLSLSFDHRIIDGASAARFVNDIVEHLADPEMMLLDVR